MIILRKPGLVFSSVTSLPKWDQMGQVAVIDDWAISTPGKAGLNRQFSIGRSPALEKLPTSVRYRSKVTMEYLDS